MKKGESLKSIAFYQRLVNGFRTTPADCVPMELPSTNLKWSKNELSVYVILLDKMRFILPMIVTEVPYLYTTVREIANELPMTETEVEVSLKKLDAMDLIECIELDDKLRVCILDISQYGKGEQHG